MGDTILKLVFGMRREIILRILEPVHETKEEEKETTLIMTENSCLFLVTNDNASKLLYSIDKPLNSVVLKYKSLWHASSLNSKTTYYSLHMITSSSAK